MFYSRNSGNTSHTEQHLRTTKHLLKGELSGAAPLHDGGDRQQQKGVILTLLPFLLLGGGLQCANRP